MAGKKKSPKRTRRSKGLQDGIYHAPGIHPAPNFCLACVQPEPGTKAKELHHALSTLWSVYRSLKRGRVADLPGHPVPTGELTTLIGYSTALFETPGLKREIPEDLEEWGHFSGPDEHDHITFNSGIPWAAGLTENLGDTALCLQFAGTSQLTIHRAIVETWKAIHDHQLPLQIRSLHQGFSREDRRSWIDFHDGISNMRSTERERAIKIASDTALPCETWTYDGTYLVFIKLAMHLDVWRGLDRKQQELLIGRDKLSGVPLVPGSRPGQPRKPRGCPISRGWEVVHGREDHEAPKVDVDSPLGRSHIHRANHHQDTGDKVNSLRIFRQGFEFLEPIPEPPGFRPGLHFLSFQDTPERVLRILDSETWLGGVNFAGDPENQLPGMNRFLDAHAAGIWYVPPLKTNEVFPGEEIFSG